MEHKILNEKIETYKNFIEDTLKVDLKDLQQAIEKLNLEKQKWKDVKLATKMLEIHNLSNSDNDLIVQNPILEHESKAVYVNVNVTNTTDVYIKIGCNCILPMNLEEANKYADIRLRALDRQIQHYCGMAVKTKAHIKVTLLAVNELLSQIDIKDAT